MDNFTKPEIIKTEYPEVLAYGHLGVQWQESPGVLHDENRLGFTCAECATSSLMVRPFDSIHKFSCKLSK